MLSRDRVSSRLTVVCSRDVWGVVRKQICTEFSAAGLNVLRLQVEEGRDPNLASACVTVKCSAEMRSVLMSKARQLKAHPNIQHVHFGGLPEAMGRHGRPGSYRGK